MIMYTLPVDQGQIIEISYGYNGEGIAYRRTIDNSDMSIIWERGELDWDREPDITDYNHIPCVTKWVKCECP